MRVALVRVNKPVGVAVIGCGLIGARRARAASDHRDSRTVVVVDANPDAAHAVAAPLACRVATDWREAIADDVDVVIVSTPNGFLAEIGTAALAAGKHVLLEKPMGRNLAEAERLAATAREANRLLKVGFNHRYHPAISEAHERLTAGSIGTVINARARYGHGGRPGYEREWRGSAELAGGGELTDQGVHVLDLLQWFVGMPRSIVAMTQTAVWPLAPLEDNGFALLRYDRAIATMHTSWTQWKNLFAFEVFGTLGSLSIEGLGRSYGTERLTVAYRKPLGGVPDVEEFAYDGPDESWDLEWSDFVQAIRTGTIYLGTAAEGVEVMRALDACYRSASSGDVVTLTGP